ncbi:MAG: HNH endonuclease, partial [Actinomycetota bacterium]
GATIDRCQAHHLQEWLEHGPTDIENLQLLCHTCHGHAHRGSRGDPRRHRRRFEPGGPASDHRDHTLSA